MTNPADALKAKWNAYAEAYAAGDADARTALLEASVTDDVTFTNPAGIGQGRDVLSAHIAKLQQAMPGAHFRTEAVHVHHGELLAVWSLHKQDGSKLATGYNFVRPAADGRFEYMAGFF